jgi:hypothetical protein
MNMPLIVTRCCDCGLGTNTAGEWYMVKNSIWEQAWRGRRKAWHAVLGQAVLCIGCLEKRLGRTLVASDFTKAEVNDPHKRNISERMRDRLAAVDPAPLQRKRGRSKESTPRRNVVHYDDRQHSARSPENFSRTNPNQGVKHHGPTGFV